MVRNFLKKGDVVLRFQTSSERYVYNQLRFNNGLMWGLALLFLFLGIQFQPFALNPILVGLGGANLVLAGIHQILYLLFTRNKDNKFLGILLVFGILLGNPVALISGIVYLKKSGKSDFIYAVYMVIVDILVIFVTLLNFFKPYVANHFFLGLIVLSIVLLFHISILFLHGSWEKFSEKIQNLLLVVLTLSSLTGNILALFTAMSFYYRRKHQEADYRETSIREKLIRNQAALLGLTFITFLIMLAVMSYLTFSYSFAVQNNYGLILQAPTLRYPFGTDNFGRDVFSRIVFGTRISLTVGLVTTVVPFVIGGGLGAISGYYGNRTDNVIMRFLDVLYAIPGILLAITIVAAFGTSVTNLVLALSIGSIPAYARTMRANVLQVTNYEFIEASRALGQSNKEIITQHIIPNAMAPMIVRATLTIGTAVISISSLSFLGLGVESHVPEWGNILRIGSQYLETQPHLAIYPGLAIILLVLSFNFMGDGVRDATDPRFQA